jgi:hypothetical protein
MPLPIPSSNRELLRAPDTSLPPESCPRAAIAQSPGSQKATTACGPPRAKASKPRRASSTFSCDIPDAVSRLGASAIWAPAAFRCIADAGFWMPARIAPRSSPVRVRLTPSRPPNRGPERGQGPS